MGLWARLLGRDNTPKPRAATQQAGGGRLLVISSDIEEALRTGNVSESGMSVTPDSAMRVAAVFASVRIISGAVGTLPFPVKRRVDEKTRVEASDTKLWKLLNRKPNRWQTPSQFRRQMQASVLLQGNGYALILRAQGARGEISEVIPLAPERVECTQADDLSISYVYTTPSGRRAHLSQQQVMHLVGLTLDGVRGVSVLTYARETIGLSLSMERHGAKMFKNGARVSGVLKHPGELGLEGQANLRASLRAFRTGGDDEGGDLILEENMDYERIALTAEDAQWIESRKFSRSDIAMFFGVPPHMIGDTEKSTSWGTGIEQQSIGFVAYTLEDHLTMWEETVARDLIADENSDLYAKFNRAALVKGDIKARWDAYVKGLTWGVLSPNEVRALEDMNPRQDGDEFYDPPNTAGSSGDTENEPPQTP